jgi:8-oxo-dGTP diphosphatase
MIQVTAAIMIDNGKVLIARRKPTGRLANRWEFPGGKVETGETPQACLQRELAEEFEIEVTVEGFLGTTVHAYEFGIIELMAFRTRFGGGRFRLHEHSEIRWVRKDELPGFEFAPADWPWVEKIQSGAIELK